MEKLKPLEEVCQPDMRYRNRGDLDHSTGMISESTIESIYRLIEPIQLNGSVPDEVRSHFEVARNLALYSWFVYSFNVVAAMQAYASLEIALKQRAGKKRISLKKSLAKHFKGRQLTGGLGLLSIFLRQFLIYEMISLMAIEQCMGKESLPWSCVRN